MPSSGDETSEFKNAKSEADKSILCNDFEMIISPAASQKERENLQGELLEESNVQSIITCYELTFVPFYSSRNNPE